ncbi:MAG: extracellular solute-binding protein [Firmicutes bacterium]|nr:extracellular solute-binding protein [Bacillota bacterium]
MAVTRRAVPIVIALVTVLSFGAYAEDSLRFLAVNYSPQLLQALNDWIIPRFEERYGVEVELQNATWEDRVDRFVVQTVGGVAPDVVVTGYYSAYEEGAAGLLLPLDPFLDSWQYRDMIPEPIWQSQGWDGYIYAMPMEVDVRGIVYSKAVFEQAGLDSSRTPQSWEELLAWVGRLTVTTPDQQSVTQRGIWYDTHAQNLFWLMMQAGVPPVDLATLESNFDTPEALAAAEMLLDLHTTSQASLPGPRAVDVLYGKTAMSWFHPGWFNRTLAEMEDPAAMAREVGIFPPQRSPEDAPVAIGFINGLAITRSSPNPELAWKLIEFLTSEEVIQELYRITGWVSPRMDIIPELMYWPGVDMFYGLVPHIQTVVVPPPRNQAQGQLDQMVKAMAQNRIPPLTVTTNAHTLWTRLLNEWQATWQ